MFWDSTLLHAGKALPGTPWLQPPALSPTYGLVSCQAGGNQAGWGSAVSSLPSLFAFPRIPPPSVSDFGRADLSWKAVRSRPPETVMSLLPGDRCSHWWELSVGQGSGKGVEGSESGQIHPQGLFSKLLCIMPPALLSRHRCGPVT